MELKYKNHLGISNVFFEIVLFLVLLMKLFDLGSS